MPLLYEYVGFTVATIPFEGDRSRWVRRPYSYRMKVHWASRRHRRLLRSPASLCGPLSLLISLSCLLGTVWIVVEKLVSNTAVEGWTSMMVVQLVMFSMLFLFLAVFSEYISRILIESKRRPLYYVSEEHGGTNFHIGGILDTD